MLIFSPERYGLNTLIEKEIGRGANDLKASRRYLVSDSMIGKTIVDRPRAALVLGNILDC